MTIGRHDSGRHGIGIRTDVDLFGAEVRADPYLVYAYLRTLGSVVFLERHDAWALPCYDEIRDALSDRRTFSPAPGIDGNDTIDTALLDTEPSVLVDQLTPFELQTLSGKIARSADELVDSLLERGSFDAVADLAQVFPASVADLVDTPDTDWNHLSPWADTSFTVHALAHAMRMFAEHPDQWDLVRTGAVTIQDAFDEVLRHDSPIPACTRVITMSVDVGDTTLPAGARVVLLLGSGNHDELQYPEPARFDVTRRPSDHLAFGRVLHPSARQQLARIAASALLTALARRVRRWHVGPPIRHSNAVAHGLASLPVERVDLE